MANVTDMKTVAPTMRLKGGLPKIGIRPTIDGRRNGVRESLEEPTMGMAKAVAALISSTPFFSSARAGSSRRESRSSADAAAPRPSTSA